MKLRSGQRVEGQEYWGFFSMQLATMVARSNAVDGKKKVINLFESSSSSEIRNCISDEVLIYVEGLTLEDFSQAAILFLIEKLYHNKYHEHHPHLFCHIADEAFINNSILPLADSGNDLLRSNVEVVLDSVGRRLGIRFSMPSIRS